MVVNKCYSLPGSLLSSIYKGNPPGIGPVFVIYYNCIFMLHYCVYFIFSGNKHNAEQTNGTTSTKTRAGIHKTC